MKERCCKRVYSGGRADFAGHQCTRNAKVEREGKHYCSLHDPIAVKAKHESQVAKWRKEDEEKRAKWNREAAMPDVLKFAQRILAELPTNRDWLDPQLEAFGRDAVKRATEGLPSETL